MLGGNMQQQLHSIRHDDEETTPKERRAMFGLLCGCAGLFIGMLGTPLFNLKTTNTKEKYHEYKQVNARTN